MYNNKETMTKLIIFNKQYINILYIFTYSRILPLVLAKIMIEEKSSMYITQMLKINNVVIIRLRYYTKNTFFFQLTLKSMTCFNIDRYVQ